MKNKVFIIVCIVFMGVVHAQESGEKNRIRLALVEIEAAAKRIKTSAGKARQDLKSTYEVIADDTIKSINTLKKAIGDISDPRALQQAAGQTRIAAVEIRYLLAFVRANDISRVSEKAKSVTRALDEATASLHISADDTDSEEIQDAIEDIEEKEQRVF